MNEKIKYLSYPFLCRLCLAFWHLDRHQNADDFLLCYLDWHPSPDDSSLWPRRKNNCRGEWKICCCCCWVIKLCLTLWALKMISGWNWQLKGRPSRHPDEGTAVAIHMGTCGNQLGKLWPQRDGWYLLEPAGLGCPQRMGPSVLGDNQPCRLWEEWFSHRLLLCASVSETESNTVGQCLGMLVFPLCLETQPV